MIAKATRQVKRLFAKAALNRNPYFFSKVQWFIAISWGYKACILKEDNLLLFHLACAILVLLWLSAKDQQVAIRNRRLSRIFSQLYSRPWQVNSVTQCAKGRTRSAKILWSKRNTLEWGSSHAKFSIRPHGYDFQAVAIPSENLIWSPVSDCTRCLDTALCCGFYLEQAVCSPLPNSPSSGPADTAASRSLSQPSLV